MLSMQSILIVPPVLTGSTVGFFVQHGGSLKTTWLRRGNAFIEGLHFPKAIASTLLVLIPKNANPISFSDYRPISLCSFLNKLISKVISTRMATLLPKLISEEQSGFVKNRNITENILPGAGVDLWHQRT